MKNFRKMLRFQTLLKEFNAIYRDLGSLHIPGGVDNDVEHSYRVAMLCWFVAEEYKLKLDTDKIIKYALLHDLVEVYAGDASIYANYSQADKEKREHAALLKLKKQFPALRSIWRTLEAYERRADAESEFVYLIEKLEPILVVLLSEQDHWHKRKVGMDDFIVRKQKKIQHIDNFAQVFNREIMAYLKKHPGLFCGEAKG